jgi:ankyrin repeat protein
MNVTRYRRYGSTALHAACLMENSEVISLLVKLGANVNAVDSAGVH